VRARWETIPVRTAAGPATAVAPVIISASRATDIPAFYGAWFAARLAAGSLAWTNPFNARQKQIVSFARARVVVFWTKNPAPLEPHLDLLDERGIGYYFTFTVNDYEGEGLEGAVPPLGERLATFRRLAQRLGSARVVWRFDPIIVGGPLTPERILEKIRRIGDALQGHTHTLVLSFADLSRYRHVRERLERCGDGHWREPGAEAVLQIAHGIQRLNEEWGFTVATCAEKVDLSAFGIAHGRCIDDELMARVFAHDRALMAFLGRGETPLFHDGVRPANPLKDPGQRASCGCIASKDVGRYGTCPHRCAYCYANASFVAADDAHARHDPGGEAL